MKRNVHSVYVSVYLVYASFPDTPITSVFGLMFFSICQDEKYVCISAFLECDIYLSSVSLEWHMYPTDYESKFKNHLSCSVTCT